MRKITLSKRNLPIAYVFLICGLVSTASHCTGGPIKDLPISFSEWRTMETLKYVNNRYNLKISDLEMLPVMVVIHYTAIETLEKSYQYLNHEEMEAGRKTLKVAGQNNIAVPFLIDRNGDIYRLMPENNIGRHVIGMNRHAIGIENVGLNEESLTKNQLDANIFLLRYLTGKYPIRYLIAHSEYRNFENTPIWEEKDPAYRTEKADPGESFMNPLRLAVSDLQLQKNYTGEDIPYRLEHLLAKYYREKMFNGVALVIHNNRIIFHKAYGQKGNSLSPPLEIQDKIYLASAAKPMTATLIRYFIEKNKLQTKTKINSLIPELPKHMARIELRHLLSHTSGIEDYYKGGTVQPGFTNGDVLALIKKQKKLISIPGTEFHYSNSNYVLLAEIIKIVSGKSFQEAMWENVFKKSGVKHAVFSGSILNPDPAVITPSQLSNGQMYSYPYKTVGAGGLFITAKDLANFNRALWNNQIISKASQSEMYVPKVDVPKKKTKYAEGWYVYPDKGTIYHDGNFGGYHTMNWLQTKKRNAIILLANHHTSSIKKITYEIDRILNGQSAEPLY